ncbi:acyl-CoA dehydrogenase very long chain [Dermatophagoides pteronyssinus]|uniref:acyl-CoA dehydrogenase very long chain n=1 Tax=Dermatophagoides pteronyssinus TaxID=6956 RepID=UPI003F673526
MFRSIATKLYSPRSDNIHLIKNMVIRTSSSSNAQPKTDNKKMEAKVDLDRLDKIKIPESHSFVQNLFAGRANTEFFLPYPQVLNNEEISFLDMIVDPVSKMWEDKWDELVKLEDTETVPEEVMQMMRDMGSFGIQVPVEYGGMGCNNTQYARLAEVAGRYDLGIGIVQGAHQSIGYKGLVLFGTPEQKAKYLPDLATGTKMAAFALTEPSAGSDASSIKTRAVLSEDGKHYILNGSKLYISNGGFADFFTVFAKTEIKNEKGEIKDKVTAFWVPRGPGLTNGPNMKKMGIKFSNTTEIWFDNVKIPVENIIGEVGEGFKVAMKILNNGRYGMICALSGTMQKAIEMASTYANTRTQFGNKLSSFTAIQEKIGRMTLAHFVTQSHAYMISGVIDKGMADFQLEAAVGKIVASDSAWHVCDEALQIFGGMGYIKETGIEKMLRDTRIFRIFEGANEILRLFIALTGLQYAGGHLREIQKAMKNPTANLGLIFMEASKRLKRTAGFDAPDMTEKIHPSLHPEAQILSKNIILFSSAVEHLLIKYNKQIVMEQMLLLRLANSVIDIYTMLVLLSRVTLSLNKNIPSAEYESQLCKLFVSEANMRVNQNLSALRSPAILKNDELIRNIAVQIFENQGIGHQSPLHSNESS